jgi:hypothetical protein
MGCADGDGGPTPKDIKSHLRKYRIVIRKRLQAALGSGGGRDRRSRSGKGGEYVLPVGDACGGVRIRPRRDNQGTPGTGYVPRRLPLASAARRPLHSLRQRKKTSMAEGEPPPLAPSGH